MSQDVQIAFPCPHLTIEERVHLSDDRRSLETIQPVAAEGLVRILANDEFFIPQAGLYSPAQLSSFVSGPYRIIDNENTLTVKTYSEEVTITLPIGERITTDQIVNIFKLESEKIIASNINGHLTFTDIDKIGTESRVSVSGTAVTLLGFSKQTGARGRNIYPGWQLLQRQDTITNRFPKFNSAVKLNPIFKVTYSVPVTRCRRCRATYVENDARFDPQGHVLMIENENLLYQAALKIILTDRGSNPYHPWYGTTIRSRIGTKALSTVAAVINEDVRSALRNLQTLQVEQSKYQSVSFKERLFQILSVQTLQSKEDPTVFLVDVVVQNASSDPISLSIVFTVPSVVALLDDRVVTPG